MANEFIARKGLISSGSIRVSGSVTASYFVGDGSQLTNIATSTVLSSSLNIDTYTFVGNGVTTNYVLSQSYDPSSLLVSVDGLSQTYVTDYTLATSTISFISAPPSQSNILIKAFVNVAQGATGSFSGSFFGIFSSASYALTASYAATAGGLGGVISSSTQFKTLTDPFTGSFTGSHTGTFPYSGLTGTPTLVSSSTQIDYNSITNKLSGVISSSAQFNALTGTSASFAATASYVNTLLQNVSASGNIEAGVNLVSNFSSGDEGGEIQLARPQTNTSISGSVVIDVNGNRVRIFEANLPNRGGYWDITTLSSGVGTNLAGGAGTVTQVNTGDGLSGGPITGTGTIALDTGSTHFRTGTVKALPIGTVSSSAQYPGWVTASSQIDYNSIQNKLSGVVSSSAQVAPLLPNGTVSSSAQYPGWVTSSGQVSITATSGYSTFSSSIATKNDLQDISINALNAATSSYAINATIQGQLANVVSSSTQVKPLLPGGTVSASGQVDITATTNYSTFSSSLATVDAGQTTRIDNLASLTSSYAINATIQSQLAGVVSSSTQVQPLLPGGTVSSSGQVVVQNTTGIGALATTGSNTFTANQIITGSLFISQNLTVLGSSSISYVSQSTLNIATNKITVNTDSPGVRFGGLDVIDSGSSPQRSGSLYFDSVNDQWIFIHQQAAGAGVTSSVVLMGPETFDNIGNETNLTPNRIPKSQNAEHLGDSQISDNGVTVSITNGLSVGTNLTASNATISGLTANQAVFTDANDTLVSVATTGTGDVVRAASPTLTGTLSAANITATGTMLLAGIISQSSQVSLTGTTGYSTFSSSIATKNDLQDVSINALNAATSSYAVNATIQGQLAGVVSSSTQVKPLLPGGTVSSSAQYPGWVTASSQIDYNSIQNKLSGVVSSSTQFTSLTAPFSGSFTGSHIGTVTASALQILNTTDTAATNKVLVLDTATNQVFTTASVGGGGGTGTVGPGTVNSIALFNASSTISSSNIFQSTNNIGIGTTAPVARLSVVDAGNVQSSIAGTDVTAYSQLLLSGSGRAFGVGVGNASETTYGVANEFFLFDHNAAAMRLAVDTIGNVGVGTTAPGVKLEVNGEISASAFISGSLLNIREMSMLVSGTIAAPGGTTVTLNLNNANYFAVSASGTGTITWVVTNPPPTGRSQTIIIEYINGGVVTNSWFTGTRWSGGVAPTLTSGANPDVLGFITDDAGTNWRGVLLQRNSS